MNIENHSNPQIQDNHLAFHVRGAIFFPRNRVISQGYSIHKYIYANTYIRCTHASYAYIIMFIYIYIYIIFKLI